MEEAKTPVASHGAAFLDRKPSIWSVFPFFCCITPGQDMDRVSPFWTVASPFFFSRLESSQQEFNIV
jgi:hypothetical protein